MKKEMKRDSFSYEENKLTLRVTDDMKDFLDFEAKRYGLTRSGYIRHLITMEIQKREKELKELR